jgi:hypothetical protein
VRCALAALAVVLAVLAVPTGSHALVVGVGDQKAEMFGDARFERLEIKHVRRAVPWDALNIAWQRQELDAWMSAAHAAGAKPLIAFTRSRRPALKRFLPSTERLMHTFRRFRRRYRWVTDYTPWNEANHCSQPTCLHPRAVARYYDMMVARCPRCTIVAADVLDVPNMVPWLREFQRSVHHEPRVWGLHNYLDANKFRTTGTRAMLATVTGEIWFTEVGGIVSRRFRNPGPIRATDSVTHAADAIRWLFRVAQLSPRIRRVYVYHWNGERGPGVRWDSGLIGADGRPRPAYWVLKRELRSLRKRRAAAALQAATPAS